MNAEETAKLLVLVCTALDRPKATRGLADIWHATLGDLDFEVAKLAVFELLKTHRYLPMPADVRAQAKLIVAERDRRRHRMQQIADRSTPQPNASRTGAAMVRYVLERLKDEGQDVKRGKFLGRERAAQIAEQACNEWLEQTR